MADTFVKHPHAPGCDGALYRRPETVHIDRTGRLGNGGIIAHDYRCNLAIFGCEAQVLVTEQAVRRIAVAAMDGA